MRFYTNVTQWGNQILIREVDGGSSRQLKLDFQPTVWVTGQNKSADRWTTLSGTPVHPVKPGSIKDTKEYVAQYNDVENFQVYESPGNVYQYIAEEYPEEIKWDPNYINVFSIDIETTVDNGRVDPIAANEQIILISVNNTRQNQVYTFGSLEFNNDLDHVRYFKSNNEESLLREFLNWWQQNYPDVITGWNCESFDITYIYNRLHKVLGESYAKKLSPWNIVNQREVTVMNKTMLRTHIAGIATLDMLQLYKKFGTFSAKESYSLDYIAELEVGERKLENPEATFRDFILKHPDTFVRYNIRDAELVSKIDQKMKLVDLAMTMAYDAKVNFEDVFMASRVWDVIIYNHLNSKKCVIPKKAKIQKEAAYGGAYVKDPLRGKHEWVISFDINSMYPMLMVSYNISPETITDVHLDVNVDDLLKQEYDLTDLTDQNLTMACNGWCFDRNQQGLFPFLAQTYYDRRVEYKKLMIKAKKELENLPENSPLIKQKKEEIARYASKQQSMKIFINSLYGFCGTPASRYFDVRLAEAITLSGQTTIRWLANRINEFLNKNLNTKDVDRVVLVDTDSVVVTIKDLIDHVCSNKTTEETINYMDKLGEKVFQPIIDKAFHDLAVYTNMYENKLAAKRENLADVMLSLQPKHYVMNVHDSEGVRYHTPQLKIMGLSMVKSSTPGAVRSMLKNSLNAILKGNETDLREYVSKCRQEFNQLSVEQIAFPRGVAGLLTYKDSCSVYKKGTPIHVRGSLLYNFHLKRLGLDKTYSIIQDGDKIKFVYLKPNNPLCENVISFIDVLPKEFNLEPYIDYNTMFEKTFKDSVQGLVNVLDWTVEAKPTLEDFFEW